MALTDTIYEKVRSSIFSAAIRFWLQALKTEKQLFMAVRLLNCSSAMQWYWFRFDKDRMLGRRANTVGSKLVRFGSRARTINRQCTTLAATYVFLDLTDLSN
ncbi:hypothetical protein M9H77_17162 [Catharanthus roseus]|uniref:Uncharacterized protein n=1 Tax=Catharanthus roseus TaxID=4058 RepID=A0ACC0B3T3_CATRO|nr:hypothetical protein M9H77_17162 [Catharanthus roseus]